MSKYARTLRPVSHSVRKSVSSVVFTTGVALSPFAGAGAQAYVASNAYVGAVGTSSSSSAALPMAASSSSAAVQLPARKEREAEVHTRPFSTLAIRPKAGSEGVGFDLITPLARRVNLRGGVSLYSGGANPTISDIDVVGHFHLASASAVLDLHPFHNGFRISPGVTLFNDTHVTGYGTLTPGTTVTFNGVDYLSSASDPLVGSSTLVLGSKIGPRLTMGWGNFIPHRRGSHFSMPFEIGAEYVGAPTVYLGVTGSACDGQGNCGSINNDAEAQSNIQSEVKSLNSDFKRLSIVPIVSMGVAYKF